MKRFAVLVLIITFIGSMCFSSIATAAKTAPEDYQNAEYTNRLKDVVDEPTPTPGNPFVKPTTSINISQEDSNPLTLRISTDPNPSYTGSLLIQVWGKDADGWTLVKAYNDSSSCYWKP
ncbi:MAG: hypothetical protein Q8942_10745, partial [Bacillota bacterium]|nr:hypothetical protein [Bacillota bacterium]